MVAGFMVSAAEPNDVERLAIVVVMRDDFQFGTPAGLADIRPNKVAALDSVANHAPCIVSIRMCRFIFCDGNDV